MENYISILIALVILYEVEAATNCDTLGTLVYEDIGCRPVMQEGHDCPIRYDCNFERKKHTCNFRGRSIPMSQLIGNEHNYTTCESYCYCNSRGFFICPATDCCENIGEPLGPGCYWRYKIGACCSDGQICPSGDKTLGQCEVNGKIYYEGARFSAPNTCSDCICSKHFNGTLEAPDCIRRNCASQIHDYKAIASNCAPYYHVSGEEILCCPNRWICPTTSDQIVTVNPDADIHSDLNCRFGEKTMKLGEGLHTKVVHWGKIKNAKCECILPPFLTCKPMSEAALN
ncbi:unnamed protein product [Phaedon cochleariae]|uniref:VWFC domain-containing protein n=1 Tax=Phaedon cochleariae TaxID=80249 RepID=A0A9N9X0B4_PHACE|nr:unnamed protein product [Phaedon cochleariae]